MGQSVKDQIESTINKNPVDSCAGSVVRKKICLVMNSVGMNDGDDDTAGFSIPKSDLVAGLPVDCISRMVRCYCFLC